MGKQMNEAPVYSREVGFDMRISYDANNRIEYIGFADPGALDSSAKWQIYKCAYDASGYQTHKRFANKSDAFDKVWDDRASYSYVDI